MPRRWVGGTSDVFVLVWLRPTTNAATLRSNSRTEMEDHGNAEHVSRSRGSAVKGTLDLAEVGSRAKLFPSPAFPAFSAFFCLECEAFPKVRKYATYTNRKCTPTIAEIGSEASARRKKRESGGSPRSIP